MKKRYLYSKAQRYFFFLTFSLYFFTACHSNRLDVNVEDQKVNIHIDRFEQDLFQTDPEHVFSEVPLLEKKYPGFYQLYFENILHFGSISDSAYLKIVQDFLQNSDIKNLEKDIDSIYKDISPLEKSLTDAFKHYLYYFPKAAIPQVITFNSTFNNGVVTADSTIAIGLDMFLGKKYKYYPSVGFPQYMVRRLSQEFIPATVIKGFAKYLYDENENDKNLISQMIYEGKILYFTDAMLPATDDSLKIGYTKKQLEWAKQNESNIWGYFLEQNLLYSSDYRNYSKYLNDGPFTAAISNEAPPMLAVWSGWQIVRKYANEHPDISLPELMKKDFEEILKGSKYKPKK